MGIPQGRATRGSEDVIAEHRLLSDEGLPALLHKARVFHVRGKGHEVRWLSSHRPVHLTRPTATPSNKAKDLDNLLSMYQIWAHGMFPKATFKDTVTRIEKVCHQRDLKVGSPEAIVVAMTSSCSLNLVPRMTAEPLDAVEAGGARSASTAAQREPEREPCARQRA